MPRLSQKRPRSMSRRTTFTTISPLPPGISREVVINFLHNHIGMIDLNPLIIGRHPIPPPSHAPEEETRCVWWSLTDKISYLPGGLVSGEIEYTVAFNNLPDGIQTHCYAPMGTDIRERWSLCGTLPGEPHEAIEIGLGAPSQGLYIREDVDLRCNFMMSAFVKKTLKKAHGALVERLCQKAATVSPGNSSNALPPPYNRVGSVNESGDIPAAATPYLTGRSFGPQAYHQQPLANPYVNALRPNGYVESLNHSAPPPAAGRANGSARLAQPNVAELQ
ncbi:hypothetical protein GGS21DRAFT_516725 [Xylaria nigripes]|nr:hypothetical protein GGS21DRAFT_516725 [Xylaria nigripes]